MEGEVPGPWTTQRQRVGGQCRVRSQIWVSIQDAGSGNVQRLRGFQISIQETEADTTGRTSKNLETETKSPKKKSLLDSLIFIIFPGHGPKKQLYNHT